MILMWYNTQTYFRKIILWKWWSHWQFIFNFSRDVCWIVNFKIWHSYAKTNWEVLPLMIVSHRTIGISRDRVKTVLWSCSDTSDHTKPAVLEQSSENLERASDSRFSVRSRVTNQALDQQTFQELSTIKVFHNYIQKQILLSNPNKDFSFSYKQPWSHEMQKSEICNPMKVNEMKWSLEIRNWWMLKIWN